MENKILVYAGIGLLIVIIIGGMFGIGRISGNVVKETNNVDLSKYRSEDVPEECRLSEYEEDLESWKQHLSHHEDTLYCLDYYK